MKKILAAAFAATAAVAFAGMNNVIISFSTPGPDKYSDGTVVLDGEKYALVWTPAGESFAGISSDGSAGASKVVLAAPVATGGRCPNVLFQVDEDYASANFKDGSWSVCLLDTRTYELDKNGKPVLDASGNRVVKAWGKNSNVVNGYGVVGVAKTVAGGVLETAGGVAAASETPASDTAAPEIKGISFDDNYVYVKIASTSPAFKYTLLSGDTPNAVANEGDSGFGSEKTDIILVSPKKPGGDFFKVNCK